LKIGMLNMDFTSPVGDAALSPEKLMIQLKEIKRKNYAISYGERVKGCICISAPVNNYVLPVALSVVGPENRIKPGIKEMVRELKSAAELLSEQISETFMQNGSQGSQ
jgi:DNA-binding IclR family transcriptional regulator